MSVRVSRRERVAAITELRAQGLSYKQVAERLGMTASGVNNVLNDPDGAKQRERRKRYQGQCVDCGMPTDGSGGYAKQSPRCIYCAQGRDRPLAARPRLRVPVRLCDVPADVRLQGVQDATRHEKDELARIELLLVAIEPSDQVYWVSESALSLIESWAA